VGTPDRLRGHHSSGTTFWVCLVCAVSAGLPRISTHGTWGIYLY
jgi:hypothetical protein